GRVLRLLDERVVVGEVARAVARTVRRAPVFAQVRSETKAVRPNVLGELAADCADAVTAEARVAAREIAVRAEGEVRQVNKLASLRIHVARQADRAGRETGLHRVRGAPLDEAVPGDRPIEDRRRIEGVDVIEGDADVFANQSALLQPAFGLISPIA